MTPNMQTVNDYVELKYDLPVGIYNCRRISGSQTYSQHSWSNANDFYTADKGLQDHIAATLRDVFGDHIRNILTWRYNSAHWNHVHVDMWPKGWLTPPCTGGELKVKYKDGSIGKVFTSDIGDDDLAILTDQEQVELQKFLAELNGVNSNVSFVRYLIPWYRKWRAKYPEDFMPSDADLSVVDDEARVAAFEAHARLNKLGDI